MEFKIYETHFTNEARIVGSVEVDDPKYDGKAYPCIEVLKNTGEIMDTYLLPKDSDFWADAYANKNTHNFVVHELGGRKKIIEMLKKII